jgi:hypothetical protein
MIAYPRVDHPINAKGMINFLHPADLDSVVLEWSAGTPG